jgi:hypothetical protein
MLPRTIDPAVVDRAADARCIETMQGISPARTKRERRRNRECLQTIGMERYIRDRSRVSAWPGCGDGTV